MSGSGFTPELAAIVAATRLGAVAAEPRHVAALALLDWVGVTIAGAADPAVEMLAAALAEEGGAAQATLLGRGRRAALGHAALINGTSGHVLDFDDAHQAVPGHASAAVAPAVLALAEQRQAGGAATLTAFIAGFETVCRLGRALAPTHFAAGWHVSATAGTIGAAAGCARLLGLDAAATARALSLAATQAAGLQAVFGSMAKSLNIGRAAANGLLAARLAAAGFEAPADAIERDKGFARATGGALDAAAALADAPGVLMRQNLFKHHASCFMTHAPVAACRALRARPGFDLKAITEVTVEVEPRFHRVAAIEAPRTGLEAKFSLRFTAALALAGAPTGDPALYSAATAARADLVALRDRVTVAWREDMPETAARVVIAFADGRRDVAEADVGTPPADLQAEEDALRAKFQALAAPVLGARAGALAAALLAIEDAEEVAPLLALAGPLS